MNPDIPSDLPTQVKIPSAGVTQPLAVSEVAASPNEPAKVRAVLKYRNNDGRESILAVAKNIHHDFGEFNSSVAVSLSAADLEIIRKNPNVDWFEGDGRVIYCSIR
mmetsp:Transcript_9618/g.14268  ORF Transcript_9618/g.14268 Transcript_9618/m.14268 type:complete len:106 (-) Transcript_9618:149-466(-)